MILIPSYIEGVNTRKDRTIRLTFGTQELTPEQGAEILRLQNKLVVVAIKEGEIQPNEIDLIDNIDPLQSNGKTQSQRIRNVLAVLFKQNNEGFKDFNAYYHHKTEIIIEHFKKHIK